MNNRPRHASSLLPALAACSLLLIASARTTGREAAAADHAALLEQLRQTEFNSVDEPLRERAASRVRAAIGALQRSRGEQDQDQLEWLGIPASPDAELAGILTDPATLRQIQYQLEQDFEPFEQAVYQELHAAIEHYRRVMRAQATKDLEGQFERRRQALRTLLARPDSPLPAARHLQLARHVIWLEEHLQAGKLTNALREAFSHPNVVLQVPRDSLILLSRQPVSRSEPVREQSGPLRTSGTSRLEGAVRLVPQQGAAPLRLSFPAGVHLTATNRLGPYAFSSRATTRLHAELDLELTRRGVQTVSSPAVSARTCLWNGPARLSCGGRASRIGGRVVDRLIARQAAEAAGRISNTVAERIQEELARLAEEQLGEINGQFQHAVLDRATRMQLQPRVWESTGSSQALTLRLTVDRQSGLGAPAPFATRKQGEAPAVSMHETFADSLANAAFRAQNFPTELDANTLQSFNDQLPVKLLERRDFLPDTRLRVFLNPRKPVRLRFLRHHIELELRANRMQLEDDTLEDARLTVAFRVRPNGETVTVTLDGEPTVTVGSQRSVDPDLLRKFQQAAREELLAALKQRVEFPSVIESDGWTLRPDRVLAEESWLTVFGQFNPPPAEDGPPPAEDGPPPAEDGPPPAEDGE